MYTHIDYSNGCMLGTPVKSVVQSTHSKAEKLPIMLTCFSVCVRLGRDLYMHRHYNTRMGYFMGPTCTCTLYLASVTARS